MKFDPSPTAIWKKYERDRDYKRSIGLYDRVRRNEAFYLGRQWEGLRVQSLDPLIFNVLRRCVNLFVSMLVSDDVAVRAQLFDMDKDGRQTAHVLERAFASAIERSGVKALGRPLLKNACVDGDACFYMHFDPALETGQAVKGDIAVELIDSTNICFGNAACDEVQRQPYITLPCGATQMRCGRKRAPTASLRATRKPFGRMTAANIIVTAPRTTATA